MPGSINLSLSQQFDALGRPLAGGELFFYAAGTTTPQSAYVDSALTIPYPNPITLDAAGRIPPFFLADGSIKIRLTDNLGVVQVSADNLVVVGPSSGGGGGGGTVDPTTIFSTGFILPRYGTGILAGFVRLNSRTIGSITSGATERANADTQNLFNYLWSADANLTVSGGRGVSAAADFAADKTITLPDARGRIIASLDDMGSTAAGRLTTAYYGTDPTVLGAAKSGQSATLVAGNLPPHTHGNAATTNEITAHTHDTVLDSISGVGTLAGGGSNVILVGPTSGQKNGTTTKTSGTEGAFHQHYVNDTGNGPGASTPFGILPPMLLVTNYIKL